MAVRTSKARWEGNLREGKGTLTVGEDRWTGSYTFPSRFEEGPGTNPEELIAAAHAACFSMALSGGLARAGYTANHISTKADVHLEKVGDGFQITAIELNTEADVPEIDEETFQQQVQAAKENCPISKALAAVPDVQANATLL